jgi:hypothetical protein
MNAAIIDIRITITSILYTRVGTVGSCISLEASTLKILETSLKSIIRIRPPKANYFPHHRSL